MLVQKVYTELSEIQKHGTSTHHCSPQGTNYFVDFEMNYTQTILFENRF